MLFSFDNECCLVDSIVINGNKKTKDHIIIREIQHKLNQTPLDSIILKDDINRLYNLGIFSSVDIVVENNIYNVNLVESYHIYPIPLINYKETTDELSYGVALVNTNLFGHNQNIFIGSFIKGETGYILGYKNPWIYRDRTNLGLISLNFNPQNIFYNYNYHFILNKLSSGFSKDKIHSYNYELGYMKINIHPVSIDHSNYDIINSKPLHYEYINLSFNYQFDKRDIYIDPTQGHLLDLFLDYYNGINNTDDILTLSLIFKKYYLLDLYTNPVFSYQIQTINKFPEFDRLPFLSYEYLGGENFVRGYSSLPDEAPIEVNELIEGSNIIYCSLEIQNTIIKRKDFGQVEFGLDGLFFFDIGTSSKAYNAIDFSANIYGYGIGLKFFISSVGPITIAIGYNPYGQNHLHLMDAQ